MSKTKFIFPIVIIIMCSSLVSAQSVGKRYCIAKVNNIYGLQKQLKQVEDRITATEKTLAELKEGKNQLHKSIKETAKIEIEKKEKLISELKDKKNKIKTDEEKKLKKEKVNRINRRLDDIDKNIVGLNKDIEELRKVNN